MYGCNNFCSYCIVPYVRGRERSRSFDDIIDEIKKLVKDGVIEVMLLGQNVNSYGNDFDEEEKNRHSFPKLLNEVANIDGIKRVRFMTSHPKDLSDELIEVIINAIYFLNKYKETEIANLLTNVVILLKIVGNNIYDYKEKKKNNNI